MIPFLNLGKINACHREELVSAMARVLDSGWYILGNEVKSFEENFAAYCGVSHVVGVANGLDALTLILRAYCELGQMGEGDEVIVRGKKAVATGRAMMSGECMVESMQGIAVKVRKVMKIE